MPLPPVLQNGDVMKVDFGVHVKGRILDSAFTLTFDHTYDKLLEAVQAATESGVRVRCNSHWLRSITSPYPTFDAFRKPALTRD